MQDGLSWHLPTSAPHIILLLLSQRTLCPDIMELVRILFFFGLVLVSPEDYFIRHVSGRGVGRSGGRSSSSSSGRSSSASSSVGRSSSSYSGRSSYSSSGSSSYGSSSRYSSSYGSGSSYRSGYGSSSYGSGSQQASLLYPSAVASSGGRAYGGWYKRGPEQYGMQHQGYESAGYQISNSGSNSVRHSFRSLKRYFHTRAR